MTPPVTPALAALLLFLLVLACALLARHLDRKDHP